MKYIGQHTNPHGYKDSAQSRNEHSRNVSIAHGSSAGKTPRAEDGQRYSESYYTPGQESGQKTSISPAARVGQVSGGEQAQSVRKPARDADIQTTTQSAGPRVSGEITHGDD